MISLESTAFSNKYLKKIQINGLTMLTDENK